MGAFAKDCKLGHNHTLGHGDKILIADGNYPLATKTGNAEKIWVSLSPGIPTVTDVLVDLQSVINVEAAAVMQPSEGPDPEIFKEFEAMLPELQLQKLGRYEFYDECTVQPLSLAIATGEKRTFANILLTVGCA